MCKSFIVLLVIFIASSYSATIELDDTNFSQTNSGNWFIKFYTPWCGHCKRLAPIWRELGDVNFAQVNIAQVDCTKNNKICNEEEIKGFPTLTMYKNGVPAKKYTGSRDLNGLQNFVLDYSEAPVIDFNTEEKLKMRSKKQISASFQLDDDNFEIFTHGKDVFIKFYANWCTHCKNLAPIWLELAQEYQGQFAEVDGNAQYELSQKFGVKGYPTLFILKANGERINYTGERTKESIREFWLSNANKN